MNDTPQQLRIRPDPPLQHFDKQEVEQRVSARARLRGFEKSSREVRRRLAAMLAPEKRK